MKYKIGDKVVPIGNTWWETKLEDTEIWEKAKEINQPYLIITDCDKDDNCYLCRVNDDDWGNWWYEKNLKPYKNTKQLIKELYEI